MGFSVSSTYFSGVPNALFLQRNVIADLISAMDCAAIRPFKPEIEFHAFIGWSDPDFTPIHRIGAGREHLSIAFALAYKEIPVRSITRPRRGRPAPPTGDRIDTPTSGDLRLADLFLSRFAECAERIELYLEKKKDCEAALTGVRRLRRSVLEFTHHAS